MRDRTPLYLMLACLAAAAFTFVSERTAPEPEAVPTPVVVPDVRRDGDMRLFPLDAAQVQALAVEAADMVAPFPWREHVDRIVVECREHEYFECPSLAVHSERTVVISPYVRFRRTERLVHLVAHELAHFWQKLPENADRPVLDVSVYDTPPGVPYHELEADCLAAAWTARPDQFGYWRCPDVLVAAAGRMSLTSSP